MKASIRRWAALVGLTAAATAGVAVSTASPAMAYTCNWSYVYLDDGSSSASVNVGRNCSDGRSHIYGTVWDDKCDGRRAELWLRFYNGNNLVPYRHEYPAAGNGCGSSASYSYSSTNASPRVLAYVRALNGGPTESTGDSSWV